eukprot:scaffold153427_cov13-Tisochrysis_lutea.AAC.1
MEGGWCSGFGGTSNNSYGIRAAGSKAVVGRESEIKHLYMPTCMEPASMHDPKRPLLLRSSCMQYHGTGNLCQMLC